jgi:hypothetical protein
MKIRVTLLSEQPRTFDFKGRLGWAMLKLVEAGAEGVTPITHPAPRWSAYVFSVRELGIPIENHHGTTRRQLSRPTCPLCAGL